LGLKADRYLPRFTAPCRCPESPMTVTKDTLLKKADALLGEARRVRKVSTTVGVESERLQMIRHAEDLEGQAARLEKDAVSAKNGVFVIRPQ
jgi:hypothetical protein